MIFLWRTKRCWREWSRRWHRNQDETEQQNGEDHIRVNWDWRAADSELLEKQNLSGEDQLGQDNTKETSETISGSETPAQAEQIQVAPEPTAVFEIHDFLNEDDSEEEAKAKEPSDEKVTVAPEPTAVFEIHDFVDELESEASAEGNSDQTGNSLSDNCSSESSSTGKNELWLWSDMIEIETVEIAVDNKEIVRTENEITSLKLYIWEKKAGSVENSDEDAETWRSSWKSVSNVEMKTQHSRKGLKIRKKKNEESEE